LTSKQKPLGTATKQKVLQTMQINKDYTPLVRDRPLRIMLSTIAKQKML